jgi:hypothetical protein
MEVSCDVLVEPLDAPAADHAAREAAAENAVTRVEAKILDPTCWRGLSRSYAGNPNIENQ